MERWLPPPLNSTVVVGVKGLFDVDQAFNRRHFVEQELRHAIATRDLTTWFQPIVRLDTTALVGFEALLRWYHPIHGPVSPPEVITAARQAGMEKPLTEAVISSCCTLMEALLKADCKHVKVAMNVSPRELESESIDTIILEKLTEKNLPTTMLEIEITEDAPLDWEIVGTQINRLSSAGISIALDDFGTGFSNLSSLKDAQIAKIKIDQSFIRRLATSKKDQLLVSAIINVGGALGIDVTAEGIETQADRRILRALGCETAQGFLFSAALPLNQAIDQVLNNQRRNEKSKC
jgi:EAL domain-containing protein (putative c-di-GMP-specific phosphodiesterase class I)